MVMVVKHTHSSFIPCLDTLMICIVLVSMITCIFMQRTLEREIRGCQHLILWTDGDREGENIADEIVDVITQGMCKNIASAFHIHVRTLRYCLSIQ